MSGSGPADGGIELGHFTGFVVQHVLAHLWQRAYRCVCLPCAYRRLQVESGPLHGGFRVQHVLAHLWQRAYRYVCLLCACACVCILSIERVHTNVSAPSGRPAVQHAHIDVTHLLTPRAK